MIGQILTNNGYVNGDNIKYDYMDVDEFSKIMEDAIKTKPFWLHDILSNDRIPVTKNAGIVRDYIIQYVIDNFLGTNYTPKKFKWYFYNFNIDLAKSLVELLAAYGWTSNGTPFILMENIHSSNPEDSTYSISYAFSW